MNLIQRVRNNIVMVRDRMKINLFLNNLKKILRNNHRTVMSIDMEFNGTYRDIGLIQLMVIEDSSKYIPHSYPIYIFDPAIMTTKQYQQMIESVFCSNTVKLMHGSDSMDIQYIGTILSPKYMKQFCENLVDTLFMCDIIRIMRRKLNLNVPQKACSLYNSLFHLNVLDQDQYNQVNRIGDKINYRHQWNIRRLSKTQTIYSALDVAFLFELLNGMYGMVRSSDDLLKTINKLYISYLSNVYHFNYPFKLSERMDINYLDKSGTEYHLIVTPDDIQNIGRLKKTVNSKK